MSGSAILSACRSPVAPRGGALAALEIHDIVAPVIRACLAEGGMAGEDVDELIVSNALGGGGNPARLAALAAGLPERVGGLSIDRQCAGGIDAILLGDALIRAGQARVVLAGGAESYSRRPLRARGTPDAPAFYARPPFAPPGHPDPDLAQAADRLARELGLSRAAMDAFAVDSHAAARRHTPAPSELVAMAGVTGDTFTRALTLRLAARARAVTGDITAANSAVAADGAAFVLLVHPDAAPADALRVMAGARLGGDPGAPARAPVAAVVASLAAAGLAPGDLAAVEVMEAYAAQAIATIRLARLPVCRTNLGGGALARGHPIGASGAINAVRLWHDLQDADGPGIATIAAAGGLGSAVVFGRAR